MPLDDTADMPSEQELAAKIAYCEGQLNHGGDNAFMKKWWLEYKGHKKALDKIREAKAKASEANDDNDSKVVQPAQDVEVKTTEAQSSNGSKEGKKLLDAEAKASDPRGDRLAQVRFTTQGNGPETASKGSSSK